MREAMAGNAAAYRRFLVSVAPHIRAVARSRCRTLGASENEVEDIVQEVLLSIHLKQATWDDTRPVGPWVAAITRNKLIDILRRRGHYVSVPIEDIIDTLPAENYAPDLTGRDVDTLLEHLRLQQREIVRSISINGDSIRATARRLQMTEGAVRVALHRALRTLGNLYRGQARED
ncbi:sigma-70 family RNA polymerase sigma factor [Methylovirgula sp. 4M-Z18]